MPKPIKNLAGQTFGYLTVLHRVEDYVSPCGAKQTMWNCVCTCGKHVKVRSGSLVNGNTKSCGCIMKEARKSKYQKEYGCKGIYKDSKTDKWIANVRLGIFDSAEEAAKAIKEAEAKLKSN